MLAAMLVCAGACSDEDLPSQGPATTAWSLGPALPRAVRSAGVTVFGQQVIVAGGVEASGHASTEVDAYDLLGNAGWQGLASLPVAWSDLNLATLGDTMYALGGLDEAGAAHAEAYRFDGVEHQWLAAQAMPTATAAAGIAASPGHIFLLGGRSSTAPLASCLEYDLTTDTWNQLPDLPEPRAYPAAMRMTDGTLVVAGGFASVDRSAPRGDVWMLPPAGSASRTWTAHKPIPEVRGDCSYGVVLGSLACAGGADAAVASRAVDTYDPYLDVWTSAESMPVERVQTQGAAATGRLFIPGGAATPDGAPTDTFYLYQPLDTAPR